MSSAKKLHVILHQTKIPGNIGSVCRAMGNMGARRLILVDPLCEIDEQARAMAVGCADILDNHVRYSGWEEFYSHEGEGLRLGFSARDGQERPAIEAEQLFSELKTQEQSEFADIYLAFGREDFGLSADDLLYFHHVCRLTTFGDYSSLNLAQAVLLALYIARKNLQGSVATPEAVPKALSYPSQMIKDWLETLGFDLSAPRTNAFRVINQLVLRNRPTQKELKILESVLQQNIRKLRDK